MKSWLVVVAVGLFAVLGYYCSGGQNATEPGYLNLHDSVQYVGMQTCMQCHSGIHADFVETGMGKSFDKATRQKSAGDFSQVHTVYDAERDLYYSPRFISDSLHITEFRLSGNDTIHKRTQPIQYIVGSGQHTNSHLFLSAGYLFQAPLTYYTQKGIWDLPPGYEKGASSRFNRQIGLECMSCHNAYPGFVQGSENKYFKVPNGIDCERCHGPGSIHVREKQAGNIVDTAKYIDYTIVNPGKLPVDLQFDLCQRCHLQGNAVLAEGKSFYDFKPGMKLSDVMEVYLPRYSNDENQFIMASHADRLKKSACFKVMAERHADDKGLRPYKNALTCVTCHNPHVSVKKTGPETFNNTCKSCHSTTKKPECSEQLALRKEKADNCVSCHMPVSGSVDIPHVTVHDHYIRKRPEVMKEVSDRGTFKALSCINNPSPSTASRAKAFVQQFERFDPENRLLLDSALALSRQLKNAPETHFALLVHLHFARGEFADVTTLVNKRGAQTLLNDVLTRKNWSNDDAWTAYRIGESYVQQGQAAAALPFLKLANTLAPHHFEFSNKLGSVYISLGRFPEAEHLYRSLTRDVPNFEAAWNNLGYLMALKGDFGNAEQYYQKALGLNPDYGQAVVNLSGLLMLQNRKPEALKLVNRYLKRFPNDAAMRDVLKRIQA